MLRERRCTDVVWLGGLFFVLVTMLLLQNEQQKMLGNYRFGALLWEDDIKVDLIEVGY